MLAVVITFISGFGSLYPEPISTREVETNQVAECIYLSIDKQAKVRQR